MKISVLRIDDVPAADHVFRYDQFFDSFAVLRSAVDKNNIAGTIFLCDRGNDLNIGSTRLIKSLDGLADRFAGQVIHLYHKNQSVFCVNVEHLV